MNTWRTLSVALQANVGGYVGGLSSATAANRRFAADTDRTLGRAQTRWTTFTKAATVGLALLTVAMGMSIREAISWESAFAGVRKTVEATEAEFEALADGIVDMANRLPASREQIAGVAEAAGQLGVERDSILEFSEVMIGLGESTNLGAEEAATGLARFANVMGTLDFERLGSTIVDLGNNSATTEAEILDMALRLAGAGKLIGATESDVFALAATMSSLGIESQLGGGAFSRVILEIYSSVQSGGDKLAGFARAAEMSAEDFAAAFEDDPIRAVDSLIQGLANTQAAGGNVIAVLDGLGIKGTQDLQVVLRLLGAGDQLVESLNLGRDAWEENSALADEVAQRYATAESQMRIFANQVGNIARVVGAELIPMLLGALDAAQRFGGWLRGVGVSASERLGGLWDDLSETGDNLVDVFDTLVDTAQPLGEALAQIGGAAVLGALSGVGAGLEEITGFLADNEAAVAAVLAAVTGLAAAKAYGLIVSAIETMYLRWLYFSGAVKASVIVQQLQLIGAGMAIMVGNFTAGAAVASEAARKIAATAVSTQAAIGLGFAAAAGSAYLATQSLNRSADNGQRAARRFIDGLTVDESNPQSLSNYVAQINAEVAALDSEANRSSGMAFLQNISPFNDNTIAEARAQGAELSAEVDRVYDDAMATAERNRRVMDASGILGVTPQEVNRWVAELDLDPATMDVDEMAAAIGEARDAARSGTTQTDQLATAYGILADETSSATEKMDAWKASLDAAFGIQKSVFDAQTGFASDLDALTASIIENGGVLDSHSEAGRNNREALSAAAQSAVDLAVAIGQGEAGLEGANESLAKNRERLINAGIAAGETREEMEAYLDQIGLTPDVVQTQIEVTGTEGAEAEITNLVRDRQIRITPILAGGLSAATNALTLGTLFAATQRWGGITSYATGGIHRQAMMGSGRGLVHWDEPATGREAYVPMYGDPSRSLPILSEAASWYGATVVPKGYEAVQRPPTPIVVRVDGSTGGGESTTNINVETRTGASADQIARRIDHTLLFERSR